MTDRYKDKPFLRLLELYVLWSIGRLRNDDEEKLSALTSKLRVTYKMPNAAWHEIVAAQMAFPPNMSSQIKAVWEKNLTIAKVNNAVLSDEDFTRMFVDKNLTPT